MCRASKKSQFIGGFMDNTVWTKVYLDHDMADKISLLGGGDGASHTYLRAGIQTALNMAVASMRLHSPLDQQHGRRSRA